MQYAYPNRLRLGVLTALVSLSAAAAAPAQTPPAAADLNLSAHGSHWSLQPERCGNDACNNGGIALPPERCGNNSCNGGDIALPTAKR